MSDEWQDSARLSAVEPAPAAPAFDPTRVLRGRTACRERSELTTENLATVEFLSSQHTFPPAVPPVPIAPTRRHYADSAACSTADQPLDRCRALRSCHVRSRKRFREVVQRLSIIFVLRNASLEAALRK